MNFAFLIKTNRKLIALAVVFSLLTTAVTLLQPAYVGTLLTAAGSGGITAPLIKLLGVLVGGRNTQRAHGVCFVVGGG